MLRRSSVALVILLSGRNRHIHIGVPVCNNHPQGRDKPKHKQASVVNACGVHVWYTVQSRTVDNVISLVLQTVSYDVM